MGRYADSEHRTAAVRRPKQAAIALAVAATMVLAACARQDPPEVMFEKARAAFAAKDMRSAEIHLKNLLLVQDGADAREMLAKVYRQGGDLRAAESELRRALGQGAPAARIYPQLIELMLTLGMYRETVDVAGEAISQVGNDRALRATAEVGAGRALAGLGRFRDAAQHFRVALEVDAGNVPAQIGLAGIDAAEGRRAQAVEAIEKLITLAPQNPDALLLAGDLQISQGHAKAALERYSKAVANDPRNVIALAKRATARIDIGEDPTEDIATLERIARGSPVTLQLRALIDFREGRLDAAADGILLALKLAPDFPPVVALAANIAISRGAYEQAETHARMLTERLPGSSQGPRLLALVQLRKGEDEAALSTVRQALSHGLDDAALHALAGEASLRLGRVHDAQARFARAVELDPRSEAWRTGLALSRLAAGDRSGGIAALEAAGAMAGAGTQAGTALVMTHLRSGEFAAAMRAIEQLALKSPRDPFVANLRGLVQLAAGDHSGARRSLEAALAQQPDSFVAAANLARLDMIEGRPDDAQARFEAVLKHKPNDTGAMIALARILSQRGGDRARVTDLLVRAHRTQPSSVEAALALAGVHLGAGQAGEAVTVLSGSLGARPDHPALLERLAAAYAISNERTQAKTVLDKLSRLHSASPETLIRAAETEFRLGDIAAAIRLHREAVRRAPDSLAALGALTRALLRAHQPAEADAVIAGLRRAGNPAVDMIEGDMYATMGRWSAAESAYKKAYGHAPSASTALKYHRTLAKTGKSVAAARLLAQALARYPDDVSLRLYAGEAEMSQSRWKKAIVHYESVIAADPGNAAALNNLAWSLAQSGGSGALEYAHKAYRIAPNAAPIADTYGLLLARAGRAAEGIPMLLHAVRISPKNGEYRLHLAEAYVRAGDAASARREIGTLLKEHPSGALADAAKGLATRM
ncbi:MAG: PEP-CTERM system TPR-repeat protein PrsT [Burkholderiaceae bacterium]